MNQLIQSKSFTTFIVLAMTLFCLGLLPQAQAQTNTAYGNGGARQSDQRCLEQRLWF